MNESIRGEKRARQRESEREEKETKQNPYGLVYGREKEKEEKIFMKTKKRKVCSEGTDEPGRSRLNDISNRLEGHSL